LYNVKIYSKGSSRERKIDGHDSRWPDTKEKWIRINYCVVSLTIGQFLGFKLRHANST